MHHVFLTSININHHRNLLRVSDAPAPVTGADAAARDTSPGTGALVMDPSLQRAADPHSQCIQTE